MTCNLCTQNDATVHLTEIVNDQTRELHLCQSCAKEKGVGPGADFGLSELLGGLADLGTPIKAGPKASVICPGCGMAYEDFRKTGRLGCGACYETFGKYLAPLLKRIHGSAQHVGKKPAPTVREKKPPQETLAQLKERLKAAVASENFEEAVRLRDQIRNRTKRKSKDKS